MNTLWMFLVSNYASSDAFMEPNALQNAQSRVLRVRSNVYLGASRMGLVVAPVAIGWDVRSQGAVRSLAQKPVHAGPNASDSVAILVPHVPLAAHSFVP